VGIPALAAAVGVLFILAAFFAHRVDGRAIRRRAVLKAEAGVFGIALVTGALAGSGLLADATRRPPLFVPMMVVVLAFTVFAARSSFGKNLAMRLPLAALIGAQAFRLPLEFVMRQAARDGVMPVQMSFEGYNFDVMTGLTALVLGVVLCFREVPSAVLVVWNIAGALLLVTVVGLALATSPWIAAFGPEHLNEWVLHLPYVYLPTLLVPAALFGHIVVAYRLLHGRGATTATPDAAPVVAD
jgi:hypothetical protein